MRRAHICSRLSGEIVQLGRFDTRVHALDHFLAHNRRVDFGRKRRVLFAQAADPQCNFVESHLHSTLCSKESAFAAVIHVC